MERMGQICRGVILLVVMGALFGTMAAAQPIKAPAVITTPGVYELSNDARDITDIYGIQIQCSNVVIDGAGHFLGGQEREKSAGVFVNQYGGSITNVTMKNLNLENWESGIDYTYVKGQKGDSNLITKCDIVKCDAGIHVEYSDFVRVEENQLHDCSSGIVVEGLSTNTDLKKNTIKGCGQGISITNSQQTTIEENTINTCKVYGVEVTDSENTIVKKNGISDNKYAALKIENSKESEISGNTLSQTEVGPVLIIGNDVHNAVITNNYFSSFENVLVDDVSTDILWNTTQKPGTNILGGPYLGGNYWGSVAGGKGYSDSAADKDGYGIADKSYKINDYNIDYLPLTHTTATKAPEEQEIIPDANITNTTLDTVSNKTSELEIKPGEYFEPSASENISTAPHVKEYLTPTPTEKPVEPKTSTNVTNITKLANVTNVTTLTPVMTINDSILNRSVANAYQAEDSQIPQVENSIYSSKTAGTAQSGNRSSQSGGLNTSSANQSNAKLDLPAQNGYLVFLVSEAGGRVILTTTTGSEIKLDPMQQKNLTVPVPVGGLEYTTYRIEKEGYTPVSGFISPYPDSGQTTTITVTLTKNASNSTSQSGLQPVQNGVKPINSTNYTPTLNTSASSGQSNSSHFSVNKTESTPSSFIVRNQTSEAVNTSGGNQSVKPVVKAEQTVSAVIVTNGINQTTSSPMSHIIKASAGPGGSITPNGSVSVEDKGTSTFIVASDDSHKISYLVIDNIKTSPMSEYRFINVTTDHTISAGFV